MRSHFHECELPGYWALNNPEPEHWGWGALSIVWGLIIGVVCIWFDGAYTIGACFLSWGIFMALIGWKLEFLISMLIMEWGESHCVDHELKRAATRELLDAADRKGHKLDETNFQLPDTPLQRLDSQQTLFALVLMIPWMFGSIHGVGLGGIIGVLFGFLPETGLSVSSWAVFGAVGGGVFTAFMFATILAVFKGFGYAPTGKQRLLILISPILVVPAVIEAIVIWWRWNVRRSSLAD